MKGVQPDSLQPECHQFRAQIVIQDFEKKVDKFARDVPQNFNNFDPFIGTIMDDF